VRRTALGLRLFIALILLATAAGKLLEVRGFAGVLASYDAFPAGLLLPMAAGIPLAELLLGAWLLSGRRLAGAAVASIAMHSLYAAWSAVSVLRGLELSNCGCFGVFLARPLNWLTVAEDLVMVALSIWLLFLAAAPRPEA
jgi:hypothetical protein